MAKLFASEAAVENAASKRCASTAATATPRNSWSSASTATRRCWCIGEGTNEIQRIIIARQLIERNRV